MRLMTAFKRWCRAAGIAASNGSSQAMKMLLEFGSMRNKKQAFGAYLDAIEADAKASRERQEARRDKWKSIERQ